MEWKYVFNTDIDSRFLGKSIAKAIEIIKPTGYRFFTWNGQVVDLHGEYIGIMVENLK